jgi:hypothetical protein
LAEADLDALFEERQALGIPGFVLLGQRIGFPLDDRRLDRVERGEHPGDCARPRPLFLRKQAGAGLCEVEDDRARFEQAKAVLLERRYLAERVAGEVIRFLHFAEGDQANVVGLPDFFKRPADPHVAGLSLALVGGGFEGGDDRCHSGMLPPAQEKRQCSVSDPASYPAT